MTCRLILIEFVDVYRVSYRMPKVLVLKHKRLDYQKYMEALTVSVYYKARHSIRNSVIKLHRHTM